MSEAEERKILSHDAVPGYRRVLFAAVALAALYLAAVFVWGAS